MKSTKGTTLRELFGLCFRSTVPSPPPWVVGTVVYLLPQRMVGFYTLFSAAHYAAVRVSPVHPYFPASTHLRGLASLGFALGCATGSTVFD